MESKDRADLVSRRELEIALGRAENHGLPAWQRAGAVLLMLHVRGELGLGYPCPDGVTHEELDRRVAAVAAVPEVAAEMEDFRRAAEEAMKEPVTLAAATPAPVLPNVSVAPGEEAKEPELPIDFGRDDGTTVREAPAPRADDAPEVVPGSDGMSPQP